MQLTWWRGGLFALAFVAVGGATAWALLTVLTPTEDPLSADDFTHVAVTQGQVESSINLNSVAQWTPSSIGTNRMPGVVTDVLVDAGDEVSQGSVLYSVDLRPVAVGLGTVPMFREIVAGAKGPDVVQLQSMLAALGFYKGTADGEAGTGTIRGIKDWQESLGVERTGAVLVGDVIFVPSLPMRVSLDSDVIYPGAILSGAELALRGLPPSPLFSMPVTDAQAAMIPAGTRVVIRSPEGSDWDAVSTEQIRDAETGTVTISLKSLTEEPICGAECAQIAATGQALLASRVVTVEAVPGLVVPTAAIITEAAGTTAVIDKAGSRIPITVKASAQGMSVIEGVPDGMLVRIPAGDEASK